MGGSSAARAYDFKAVLLPGILLRLLVPLLARHGLRLVAGLRLAHVLLLTGCFLACPYGMLCFVMLCYIMLCYAMLCYAMLCYAMLRYAMLCCVMLCYVMLCYVLL